MNCISAGAQALHPLFRAEEDPGTRDNAAGAVGRIIATIGSQVPLEQVPFRLSIHALQDVVWLLDWYA